jgi:hypothetical protein
MTPRGIASDLPLAAATAGTPRVSGRPLDEHHRAWEREMERAQLASWFAHDPLLTGAPLTTGNSTWVAAAATAGASSAAPAPASSCTQQSQSLSSEDRESGTGQDPSGPHVKMRRLATALQEFGYVAVTSNAQAPAGPVAPASADPIATEQRLLGVEYVPAIATDPGGSPSVLPGLSAGATVVAVACGAAIAPRAPLVGAETDGVQVTSSAPSRTTTAAAEPIRLHADWSADGVRLWLALDANVLDQMGAIARQLRQWVKEQGVKMLALSCNGKLLTDEADPLAQDQHSATGNFALPTPTKEKKLWPSAQ